MPESDCVFYSTRSVKSAELFFNEVPVTFSACAIDLSRVIYGLSAALISSQQLLCYRDPFNDSSAYSAIDFN